MCSSALLKHRRGGNAPLEYPLPDGPLVKALLAHINMGHTLLTEGNSGMTSLFVSRHGNQFSNATFCHFWKSLMRQVNKQEYFPPATLRTMFVEEYTSAHGAEPEMWDGCAAIMGNSVAQWKAHYNPSAKRRAANQAIQAFDFKRKRAAGEGAGGVEVVEADDE